MARRVELGDHLKAILGTSNCYFNPPETKRISYPAIIYARSGGNANYADNRLYTYMESYSITVIDRNPDSEIPMKIQETFELCRFERFFVSDNLNHWVLEIYY